MKEFRTRLYTWKVALEEERYQSHLYRVNWDAHITGMQKTEREGQGRAELRLCKAYLQCNAPSSQYGAIGLPCASKYCM